MKLLIATVLGALLLGGCTEEKPADVAAVETPPAAIVTDTTAETASVAPVATETATASSVPVTVNENHEQGTWAGQIKVAQPVSMFNYVGAESGDFAPMRFRNDSEAGRKILAACSNDDNCEFTGTIEWLDETPPPDASAIGQIISVASAKRLPAATP